MELNSYLFIILLSIFFSTREKLISSTLLFFVLWFLVYLSLAIVVRANFDRDINVYASAMSYTSTSLYYLKEPVIWLGQRIVYGFTQDHVITFIIFDIFAGVVLFATLKNFEIPQYGYFSILAFFPFVLGMQNVYRQWISMILFLYSFSFAWNSSGRFRSFIWFLIAVASHHAAAIFLPLLFAGQRKLSGNFIWGLSLCISFAGIFLGTETKSHGESGADLRMVYLTILGLFIIVLFGLDQGSIKKRRLIEYKIFIGLFILSAFSAITLSSTGAERVSMFCLMILYPIIINVIEQTILQRLPVRISVSILGFLPMVLFDVSNFIM